MLKEAPKRADLENIFSCISKFSNENYHQILPNVEVFEDEKDFYFGILQRVLVFSTDISAVLRSDSHSYYTTVFIIARCVYDDFLTLKYIEHLADPREQIYRLNAKAKKQQFDKLNDLAELNENYYNNQFPFYTTKEQLLEIKQKFIGIANHLKYFESSDNLSINNMPFKSFPNHREMVKQLDMKAENDLIGRAYFFWRQWSDYVHFSPHGYQVELGYLEENNSLLRQIQEMGVIMCKSIGSVLRFFHNKHGVKPIDTYNVAHRINLMA